MDYNSVHGQDVSNFSPDSPHRMPTVSAAQALQDLKTSPTRCISTGLNLLDCALQRRDVVDDIPEGVSRGKVTEVYGPPGVGKTALGMQLASNVLKACEGVIWVDAAHPLSGPRFSQILRSSALTKPSSSSSKEPSSSTISDLLLNFTHFSIPTLAHFVALLSHPTSNFPLPITSLIVIDSLSTLINSTFPRTVDAASTPKKPGAPNPSARKFPILQYILNSLTRLATTRNIAVVILSQCVTKMRPGAGAVLVPAINTTVWDQGLGARIAMFRDWGWESDGDDAGAMEARFVEVMQVDGAAVSGGRKLVPFAIGENGLYPLSLPVFQSSGILTPLPQNPIASTPVLPQKRKFSATDLEVPDSEGEDDEDYGWGDEDEDAVPEMPPQWQGSEDILVPAEGELEEEEQEQEDEEEVVEGVEEGVGVGAAEIDDSEDELAIGQ